MFEVAFLAVEVAGGLYVIARHRANIQRLLAGQESKIGSKKKAA